MIYGKAAVSDALPNGQSLNLCLSYDTLYLTFSSFWSYFVNQQT